MQLKRHRSRLTSLCVHHGADFVEMYGGAAQPLAHGGATADAARSLLGHWGSDQLTALPPPAVRASHDSGVPTGGGAAAKAWDPLPQRPNSRSGRNGNGSSASGGGEGNTWGGGGGGASPTGGTGPASNCSGELRGEPSQFKMEAFPQSSGLGDFGIPGTVGSTPRTNDAMDTGLAHEAAGAAVDCSPEPEQQPAPLQGIGTFTEASPLAV